MSVVGKGSLGKTVSFNSPVWSGLGIIVTQQNQNQNSSLIVIIKPGAMGTQIGEKIFSHLRGSSESHWVTMHHVWTSNPPSCCPCRNTTWVACAEWHILLLSLWDVRRKTEWVVKEFSVHRVNHLLAINTDNKTDEK